MAPCGSPGFSANNVGRITTAGAITRYPVPTSYSELNGIAAGPDGAIWFTESTPDSFPHGITAGPDGALWFTETAGRIGRITTSIGFIEFPVPTPGSEPLGITSAPDGALWFTEYTGNKIARITTGGLVTEFPLPHARAFPSGITTGFDGALWFTLWNLESMGHAPVCALGFNASYASGTLTMSFDLGIDTPATLDIILHGPAGTIGEPFGLALEPVRPPYSFTMKWASVPAVGEVTVQPVLQGTSGAICSEWTTVNTTP
ncbi:MAG TPA: hypothetical protein VMU80_09490 [Bryobacteraceae bacterium]|nr:hypothetical protein [Bryobacteraceae bacterium]